MNDKPSPQRDDFDKSRQDPIQKLDNIRKAALHRARRSPSSEAIARRQSRLQIAKWALPILAGLFLASIIIWPEINHLVHQDRAILREMRHIHAESGNIVNAVYRDIDSHNHPYTLTARTAHQIGNNHIDLDHPEADIILDHGVWLHLRSNHGVYLRHDQTLNLDGHVILYRNDGLLLNTPSADIDLDQGVMATHNWVHAEGPFGTQDAQSAFLDQQRDILQFMGPGLTNHFNDVHPSTPSLSDKKRP